MAKLKKANLSNIKVNRSITSYSYDSFGKSKLFNSFGNIFESGEEKTKENNITFDVNKVAGNILSTILNVAETLRGMLQTGAQCISANISSISEKINDLYGGEKDKEEVSADLEDNQTEYSAAYEYTPKIKTGTFNTYLFLPDCPCEYYSGKYLEFVNEDGISFKVPLAIVKYENNKIVFVPMNDQQIENYTEVITAYYNDIMKNYDSYSDQYKSELSDRLSSVSLVYIDPATRDSLHQATNGSWAAYCCSESMSNRSNLVIDTSYFVKANLTDPLPSSINSYNYMLETFTHETGHVYANNRASDFLEDRDQSYTWKTIYNQVSSNSSNANIMRSYSVKNQQELFADAVLYYYHYPNKLKMVEINVDGYSNLYDYMDYILN